MRTVLKLSKRKAYRLFRSQSRILSDGIRFRDVKATYGASGLTLETGAKLYYSRSNGYFISGYHHDGNDVVAYAAYGKLIA